ncbi:phosphonoacetaldehyde reductase [Streptomyces sp. NPDC060020]|uniref:phosphonoacetaldehyde reductase n=1 Tax=Streptomyces sp. NPDC060020 TaxID=3347038 RepID=UPI0036ACDE88
MTARTRERETALLGGRGSFAGVPGLLTARRVLVVASKGTLHRTRAERWLPPEAEVFTGFCPNPGVEHAVHAARRRAEWGADLVMGIGGGSALDVAKAAALLPADADQAEETILGGRPVAGNGTELLLVPTTAGTGSEVTQFATLYRGRRKVSLDTPRAQADVAVVDPALTDSCPPSVTWSCAFDALAHAVESLWSVRSTELSRAHAREALRRIVAILREADETPSRGERDALSEAATLAGQAINITRTTAAHALSYPLTARLEIPHGLACALNLIWLMPLVERAGPRDVLDQRGPDAVRGAVSVLGSLFGCGPGELGHLLGDLVARRVASIGVRLAEQPSDELLRLLVAEGLASNRMGGMPVRLEPEQAYEGLRRTLAAHLPGAGDGACATTG